MKRLLLLLAAAVLGVGLGLSQTAWHFGLFAESRRSVGLTDDSGRHDESDRLWQLPGDGRKPRSVVLGNATYDFGVMEFNAEGRHEFVIRNEGDYPLAIERIESSCSCTLASVPEDPTPPGKETRVVLEWSAKNSAADGRQFRQWARLRTNDPNNGEIRLVVQGELTPAVAIDPWELVVGRVPLDATRTVTANLLIYRTIAGENEPWKVMRVEISDPLGAQVLTVDTDTMTEADRARHRGVAAGYRVVVTLKPGLPVGPFRQKIRLHTNLPEVDPVELAVVGEIIADGSGLPTK